MRRSLLLLVPLSLGACTAPISSGFLTANYRPSEEMPPALPSCAAPVTLAVTDGRKDTSNVGRRFWEEQPKAEYPIFMYGKPVAFIEQGLSRSFKRAGHPVGGENARSLAVNVTQLSIEEKVFRNSEYDGYVMMEVSLMAPGGEQPCWTGRVRGVAENYGKAGSELNYQETLSHALDRAALELFNKADFGEALCGKCAATPTPGSAQTL